ncbi:MAG: hypothetical protein WCO09_03025, partial [bacterium]
MNSTKRIKIAGLLILAVLLISVSVWGIKVKNQKAYIGGSVTVLDSTIPFTQYPMKTYGGFSLAEIVSKTSDDNIDKALADLQFNIDDIKQNIKTFISTYYTSGCDTRPYSDSCVSTETATLNALTTYTTYVTTYDKLKKESTGSVIPTTVDFAGIASQSLISTMKTTGVDSVDTFLTELSTKVDSNLTYAIAHGNIPPYVPTFRADTNASMMRFF